MENVFTLRSMFYIVQNLTKIHARYEFMCHALLCFALLHCAMPTRYELRYMINVRDIKLYDVKKSKFSINKRSLSTQVFFLIFI